MNFNNTILQNSRLFPRNEGKLKCYESCSDLRAWSHDSQARDNYLKEWIKSDMPVSVIPSCTLVHLLKTMTCKKRIRPTPQCHPDCKSKMVLESICNSCEAVKKCFKNEKCFDKFFNNEELETSHWPCERCLDALKSIKMFWKIILDKIFNISLPKCEESDKDLSACGDNIHSVTKGWQSQIVHEAAIVKNYKSYERQACDCNPNLPSDLKKVTTSYKLNVPKQDTSMKCDVKTSCVCHKKPPTSVKCTNTDSLTSTTQRNIRISRQTSARVKTANVACECYNFEEITNEINEYKFNLNILQSKLLSQNKELEILRKEAKALKIELQNLYKCASWRSLINSAMHFEEKGEEGDMDMIKPFEEDICPQYTAKGIDSEMIITMKHCKNETYRHISLLQVLHKSNTPAETDLDLEQCCNKTGKQDPIKLLTKAKLNFGEMVKREMYIASGKGNKNTEVDAISFDVKPPKLAQQEPPFIQDLCCCSSNNSNNTDVVKTFEMSDCLNI